MFAAQGRGHRIGWRAEAGLEHFEVALASSASVPEAMAAFLDARNTLRFESPLPA